MVASKKTSEIVVGDYFFVEKTSKKLLMTIDYELNIEKSCFNPSLRSNWVCWYKICWSKRETLMYTHVYICLPMSTHVYSCLPMSAHICPCLPMSTPPHRSPLQPRPTCATSPCLGAPALAATGWEESYVKAVLGSYGSPGISVSDQIRLGPGRSPGRPW